MPPQSNRKNSNGIRYDSHHVRLRTGESEKKGGYAYRWTDDIGKRHSVYAQTLNDLREKELQVAIDRHDGIKSNVKTVTINDVFDLWRQVKRGIKDSTILFHPNHRRQNQRLPGRSGAAIRQTKKRSRRNLLRFSCPDFIYGMKSGIFLPKKGGGPAQTVPDTGGGGHPIHQ